MSQAAKAKKFDLEAVESALRTSVLAAGANLLAELLDGVGSGRRTGSVRCGCGMVMTSKGLEKKTVLTILGPLEFKRSRYECPHCHASRYPGDEDLDVANTSRSPGVRRMMARAGSRQTFKEARADLLVYAGLKVSAKDVERVAEKIGAEMENWQAGQLLSLLTFDPPPKADKTIPVMYIEMDGTGVPMVKEALVGRKGKQSDGSSRTREAKLGCVFTQTGLDGKGRPIRDPDATSFVGAIETAEAFGPRIEAEAIRRGLYQAEKVVVLGDGAVWIRNLAQLHFPQALHIVDLYHAREHLDGLIKLLCATDDNKLREYRLRWWTALDEGRVEDIAREAASMLPLATEIRNKAQAQIHYLEENKDRMRYAHFRKLGLFVGSGVIEAGCKAIIGARLKQSGMEWSLYGANTILALRCIMLSGRFEDFWEDRAAA